MEPATGAPSAPGAVEPPAQPPAPTDTTPSPPVEPADAPPPAPRESALRFWMRPLILSGLVLVLLVLTLWDSRRVPNRPAPPTVHTATPPAGGATPGSDPALVDSLVRLRQALARRDARALANLADPDGIVLGAYSGGLPESGYNEGDAFRLAQAALPGASLSILGWRTDARGRVVVLTDGWQRKPLRLAGGATLELTSLSAVGLVSRNGLWYWRWLLPDTSGALAQQARSSVWQPLDVRN